MSALLDRLQKTKRVTMPRIVLYGLPGAGKSSLIAQDPDVAFFNFNDGLATINTREFTDVKDLKSFRETLQLIEMDGGQTCKSIAIEGIGELENMFRAKVISDFKRTDAKGRNITDIGDMPYGSGWTALSEMWTALLDKLTKLNHMGLAIYITGHSSIKIINNPLGEDYESFQPLMREKDAQLLYGWATFVGFMTGNIINKEDDRGKIKVVTSGRHILCQALQPTYMGKNRYNIQTSIKCPSPMEGYKNLMDAIIAGNQ